MSRAALAAVVAVLAVAGVVAAVAIGGRSDDEGEGRRAGGTGKLAWEGKPRVIRPESLPRDRILTADVRNDTLKEVELRADKDVELLDRRGRPVTHTTIFTEGFTRDIYPPRYQRKVPRQDQLRLGLLAQIKPGESVPVTIAWRVRSRDRNVVRLRTPAGVLGVPSPD